MFCKVKPKNTGLSLYLHDGTHFLIDGRELDAYKLSNNQVIILHPGGAIWLDKGQVEDVDTNKDEAGEQKISGLRNLIGQDMKQIAIEFK